MSDTKDLTLLGSQKTKYEYDGPSADQLETFELNPESQIVGFQTDEFTSLCPKTGQPDFASIDIAYIPDGKGVESKSLKLYLFRFRNHGSFHEDCIETIKNDIVKAINPAFLRVVGDFTKRGGIAIKPMSFYVKILSGVSIDYSEALANYDRYKFER